MRARGRLRETKRSDERGREERDKKKPEIDR